MYNKRTSSTNSYSKRSALVKFLVLYSVNATTKTTTTAKNKFHLLFLVQKFNDNPGFLSLYSTSQESPPSVNTNLTIPLSLETLTSFHLIHSITIINPRVETYLYLSQTTVSSHHQFQNKP